MTEMRFISDDQLRRLIERDRKELEGCLVADLHKAALVLAGSIIEAILVDYYLAFPRPDKSSRETVDANLASLIDWAQQDGLISPRTKEISTVIRNYRNLIHPGRELRLQERVDAHTAQVAKSLVEIIIDEIAENYSQKLGYTADQAIQKVRLDPGASAILSHIVKTMQPPERAKLFRLIPSVCAQDSDDIVETFVVLHNCLKPVVPDSLFRAEAAMVYKRIRSNAQRDALFLLRFFRNDAQLLADAQREAVTDYLLDVLRHGRDSELRLYDYWGVFEWLTRVLDSKEGGERLWKVVPLRSEAAIDIEAKEEVTKTFLQIIARITWSWGSEADEEFLNQLDQEFAVSREWTDLILAHRLPF